MPGDALAITEKGHAVGVWAWEAKHKGLFLKLKRRKNGFVWYEMNFLKHARPNTVNHVHNTFYVSQFNIQTEYDMFIHPLHQQLEFLKARAFLCQVQQNLTMQIWTTTFFPCFDVLHSSHVLFHLAPELPECIRHLFVVWTLWSVPCQETYIQSICWYLIDLHGEKWAGHWFSMVLLTSCCS